MMHRRAPLRFSLLAVGFVLWASSAAAAEPAVPAVPAVPVVPVVPAVPAVPAEPAAPAPPTAAPPGVDPRQTSDSLVVIITGVTGIGIGLLIGIAGAVMSGEQNHRAIMTTAALAEYDDLSVCLDESRSPPECDIQKDAHTDAVVSQAIGLAGFGLAGAAGMMTLIYAFAPVGRAADMPVRAALGPVPGGGALVLTGSF